MRQGLFVFLTFVCLGVLVSRSTSAEPDTKSSPLLGTWKITAFQDDGRDKLERLGVRPPKKNKPDEKPKVAKLVFTKDECYILRGDGRREMASGLANAGFKSWKIDDSTTPHSIDITGFAGKKNEKTKTYPGIVKLDGKKLTICYCEQGKRRPTKFESDGANNLFEAELLSRKPEPLPKKISTGKEPTR